MLASNKILEILLTDCHPFIWTPADDLESVLKTVFHLIYNSQQKVTSCKVDDYKGFWIFGIVSKKIFIGKMHSKKLKK